MASLPKVTLLTYGTRGDVQPYVALGLGLRRAGWAVRLAAPEPFAALVSRHGLDFASLPGDPAQLSRRLVDEGGRGPLRTVRTMIAHVMPVAYDVMQAVQGACRDADLVVHSFLMLNAGHEAARARGVPDAFAQIFPVFTPTAAFPALMMPALPLGRGYHRLTHTLSTAMFWRGVRLGYAWLRRAHPDLAPLSGWPFKARDRRPPPVLYGFSPRVVPPPPDWGSDVHVTGYWHLDAPADWEPPAALRRFLDAGPPPVYVGFGSMVTRDAARITRTVLEALALTGRRAVLQGGWGALERVAQEPALLSIGPVPHDWLFPRVAAAVHHGGAGTTAASLRAGVPTLVVPFAADQSFWGARVAALGIGPAPIPRRRLTARRLAGAIERAAGDPALRQRAAAMGERLRAEDGVATAVARLLEG